MKEGKPILVTMDLTIIEVKGLKLLGIYDEETDLLNFAPEPE